MTAGVNLATELTLQSPAPATARRLRRLGVTDKATVAFNSTWKGGALTLTNNGRKNPFAAGFGNPPSVLAGRDHEEGMFVDLLADLRTGPPRTDVVLVGPRGTGKTVLLDRFASLTPSGARVVRLTGDDLHTPRAFAAAFIAKHDDGVVTDQFRFGFSQKSLGITIGRKWEALPNDERDVSPIKDALTAAFRDSMVGKRRSEKPLVVFVDEGQEVGDVVLKGLFNASQTLKTTDRKPSLVVIAGTPGLDDAMRRCRASFASLRAEKMRIGRLDRAASVRLLTGTAAGVGITLGSEVVDKALEHAQGYPYFLQAIGASIVAACWRRDVTHATERELEAASAAFLEKKEGVYGELFDELNTEGLLEGAVALSWKLKTDRRTFRSRELEDAMRDAGIPEKKVGKLFRRIRATGFVWRERGNAYSAGVPSIVDYVREQSPEIVAEQEQTMEARRGSGLGNGHGGRVDQ